MSILVLESNPAQAATIRHIVCDVLDTELTLVESIDQALQALHTATPDLVLLPPLVAPAEEAKLVTFLRTHPKGAHIETLITPVLGSPAERAKPTRRWRKWGEGRASTQSSGIDETRAFADRLAWSLHSARERRQPDVVPVDVAPHATTDDAPTLETVTPLVVEDRSLAIDESVVPAGDDPVASAVDEPVVIHERPPSAVTRPMMRTQSVSDRRARRRFQARELEALRAARLKNGQLVHVHDVSEGGALVESDTPFELDSEEVLELITDVLHAHYVPFRVKRCEIVTRGGKPRYIGGCAFLTPLQLEQLRGTTKELDSSEERASDSDDRLESLRTVLRPYFQTETAETRSVPRGTGAVQPVSLADRRRHVRVDGPFEGSRRGIIDVPIRINNLSEGGCFVDSRLEVEPGHQLTLVVQTPEKDRITVTAEVVHNQAGIGFAVRFIEMPDSTRNEIVKLVAAREKTLAALQAMTA